jgi:hypothetical protein
MLEPLWRNFIGDNRKSIFGDRFNLRQRGIEGFPACDVFVNCISGKGPAQGRVWKVPLASIEAVALGAT